jgi:group I intron endonuclease
MILYKITNKVNGKSYIGQSTRSIETRWKQHCRKTKSRYKCTLLYYAIQKYGSEAFEIKPLARCNSLDEMNHREEYYIKIFNTMSKNGYNLTTGGKSRTPSVESRRKMSRAGKGRKKSKKHRDNISMALSGRSKSASHKINISNSTNGLTAKKAIICDQTGIVYASIVEAAKILKLSRCHLSNMLCGRNKTCKGLTFTYI